MNTMNATKTNLELEKEKAARLYEQGIKNTQEYSEEFVNLVKNKPWISLAIAGGLGFILSAVFKKQK